MSDIEFDADIQGNPRYGNRPVNGVNITGGGMGGQYVQPGASRIGMVNWLIRHGIITGESSAKTLLIGLVVFNFVAAGLILYFFVLR
jgi:hypothetical protein